MALSCFGSVAPFVNQVIAQVGLAGAEELRWLRADLLADVISGAPAIESIVEHDRQDWGQPLSERGDLGLDQVLVEASDVVQHAQRHRGIDGGLEFDQEIEKQALGKALPVHLERPDDVFESLLEQPGDVIAAVVPEGAEVHQGGDLGRGEAFDELLDEFRVAEELFVAGVVVVGYGVRTGC